MYVREADDFAVPLRQLRSAVRRDVAWLLVGWLLMSLFLSGMVMGLIGAWTEPDLRLVQAGPVVQAKVLSVTVSSGEGRATLVKVARPADGGPEYLRGGNDLDPKPRVGETVAVVASPDDPSYVLAADVDWRTQWWHYLLILLVPPVLAAVFGAVTFGQVRFPGAVRRSFRKLRAPDAEVTVVHIDRPERPDPGEDSPGDPDITLLVRDRAGLCWRWAVRWFEPGVVDVGDRLPAAGEPREGAWMVGLVAPRLLLPVTTLQSTTVHRHV